MSSPNTNVGIAVLAVNHHPKRARRTAGSEADTARHLIVKVADGLVRVRTGSRLVKPELEIPKLIHSALKAGTAKRFGGVVRQAETGSILKHLKEIKPGNVRKLL